MLVALLIAAIVYEMKRKIKTYTQEKSHTKMKYNMIVCSQLNLKSYKNPVYIYGFLERENIFKLSDTLKI